MKRKLKDLKENECIKVNTLAQAKYFIDKFGFNISNQQLVGGYVSVDRLEGEKFYWVNTNHGKVERPASDFIKPKKSGMKQAIKELRNTCKELAETQQKTNEYLEVLNGRPQATIETTKGSEFVGGDLTEKISHTLPENWQVYFNTEQKSIIKEFLKWKNPIVSEKGFLYFDSEEAGYCISSVKQPYHKLITFEDFQKYVLKNDQTEPIGNSEQLAVSSILEHAELEAGKWYKFGSGALQFNKNRGCGYGINRDGLWLDDIEWLAYPGKNSIFKEANPEEVESALIKEAERIGFNLGSKIKVDGAKDPVKLLLFKEYKYEPSDNTLYWCVDNLRRIPLFRNGTWAEIIQKEQTIDWSKPGKLVDYKETIVVTSGKSEEHTFTGTIISVNEPSEEKYCIGSVHNFMKHIFKPYNGTITLKND